MAQLIMDHPVSRCFGTKLAPDHKLKSMITTVTSAPVICNDTATNCHANFFVSV